MRHNRYFAYFLLLMAALALWSHPLWAQSEAPTAVTLTYYRAFGIPTGTKIEWGTASEFQTGGFLIERGPSQSGPFTYLSNIGFIEAVGYEIGANYSVVDTSAALFQGYWYRLVEVETSGTELPLQAIYVVAGATPTATPNVIGVPTTQATATLPASTSSSLLVTATRTPTATRTGTAGPSPTLAAGQPTQTRTPSSPVATTTTANRTATPGNSNGGGSNNNNGSSGSATQPAATPVAIAQVTAETGGYPGQPTAVLVDSTPTVDINEPGYVPPPTELPQLQPAATTILGQPSGVSTLSPNGTDTTETSPSDDGGRFFLWAGFLAALFIFLAGVGGAIFLFTRPQEEKQEDVTH